MAYGIVVTVPRPVDMYNAVNAQVNEALGDSPEQINEDPYGEGWLVRVRLSDPSELDALMDSTSYQESLS